MQILRSEWLPAPARIPAHQLAVAVGDPHGMSDHLAALLDAVLADVAADGRPSDLVYLGDYGDRGPDLRGVIDLAMRPVPELPLTETALMGNHDAWLVDLINDRLDTEAVGHWLANGGLMTLEGLGVELTADLEGVDDLAGRVRAALGPARVDWLNRLGLSARIGGYLFVHAGIDPATPLANQGRDELLWIRQPFLEPPVWIHDDLAVVHGHTPGSAEVTRHRVGTDTGCFKSGVLTAAIFDRDQVQYVCAAGDTDDRAWSPGRLPAAVRVANELQAP
jgi:serine/threonine protein phosphatase 1